VTRAQITRIDARRRPHRWLARLALTSAAAAATVPLVAAGLTSVVLAGLLLAALAVALAAGWWFLSHRGPVRWLSALLAAAAPLAVLVFLARNGLVWVVVLAVGLWAVAVTAARAALADRPPVERPARPPRHPYLIMNPASGGGKVGRHRLAERARALGAEVHVLDPAAPADVARLATDAVRRGADLLGVAGGDGTQALVAEVAARHRVPFLVISAGTRNHFAADLGLDRAHPARCLDALRDGVALRVDLGFAGDRPFVNNASFGAYAELVRGGAYRRGRTRTALRELPGLLDGEGGPRLVAHAGGVTIDRPQALLVSNNPYRTGDPAGLGRRDRLDAGVLGVIGVRVRGAFEAAGLVRAGRSRALTRMRVGRLVVDADAASVPAGLDGEAVLLPTPVRCVIAPAVLEVLVPRDRPGGRRSRPRLDWADLWHRARGGKM
jgi:diacylglycerol kinase family enzyme